MDLATLMTYFERFWMDQVTPLRFTVYRLQHRTNNFIESYHSSLLRLMGHRPQLYRFYDNLRTIELRARNDFTRALNGQRVRQSDYRIYPQNNTTINNAWFNVENGRYTLEDFLRNVSYTPERILRNELGEPNFEPRPAANVQPLPPPQPPQPLILGPLRPPSPLPVLPLQNRVINIRGRGNRGRANIRRGRINGRGVAEAWAEFYRDLNNEPVLEPELEPQSEPQSGQEIIENPIVLEVCIICMEGVANIICQPCCHAFCNTCVTIRLLEENFNTCPLCRRYVDEYRGYVP